MKAVSQATHQPLNNKRLIPLDFQSVQKVPDSHSWNMLDDSTDLESAPIIDLSDHNAVNKIRWACETWGIFHVINHGIPTQLIKDVEFQGRRLFSLPIHEKVKAVGSSPYGVVGYASPRMSPFFDKLLWNEGFSIIGSPVENARKLWPQDYTKFCDVMEEYQKGVEELSGRLMWLMLNSLGISRDDVEWVDPTGVIGDSLHALKLNSYPVCPDPNRAMGLGEHTDSSLITVLHQSIGGLQVYRDGVGWLMVPPVDGALIVTIGDLFHSLTNGRFMTPLHRAIMNQNRYRLSVAYFYGPPMDVQISPLKKLVDHEHPPLYRSVTWKEFLALKAKHFNEALTAMRIAQVT